MWGLRCGCDWDGCAFDLSRLHPLESFYKVEVLVVANGPERQYRHKPCSDLLCSSAFSLGLIIPGQVLEGDLRTEDTHAPLSSRVVSSTLASLAPWETSSKSSGFLEGCTGP